MKPLAFAARSLRREFRHAEMMTLAAALMLAVAALTAVATLASRVERALIASAAELIGGDLGVNANRPLPAAFADEAHTLGLATSVVADFSSMAFTGEQSKLCEVRAGDPAFPLRGTLTTIDAQGREQPVHAPSAGTIYADHAVFVALGVSIGARVQLGGGEFTLAGEIGKTPDSGNPFRLAPRVLMNLADAQASGMLAVGSRVRYRLLVAGEERAVTAFAAWVKPHLPAGVEILTAQDAQQNLRGAFERGESFLRLTALLAALLSGVAVALAAQRFARRKVEEIALLRCLGANRAEILIVLLLELALLALPACIAGVALGLGLQQVVLGMAEDLLPGTAPRLTFAPPLTAFVVGFAVLLGFALPPLLRLRDVAPMRVFRHDVGARVRRFDALYLLPLAVGAVLIAFGAGNLRLAATLGAGFVGVGALTFVLGLALLALVRMAAARLRGTWRFGLANLARRRALSLVQAGALALSLTALALLGVIGPSLLERWRADLPPDTPNWFLINLQTEQLDALGERLHALRATNLNTLPLAVGKLVAINGRTPKPEDYPDRRAATWINGETRLSWSAQLPAANKLLQGRWFDGRDTQPALSVDRMWSDMFHLKLGDTLTLKIGEQDITATIISIRDVDWDSFRANFFLMLDPATGANLPHSHVASFHLDGDASTPLAALSRDYPNLSLIDLNALLDRIRDIVNRVTQAITWVLGFSLLAGVLVLLAALAATADERRFEAALLRTLGAHRAQLTVAVLTEFCALGLLSGMIAVAGSAALGGALAHGVFHMSGYTPPLAPLAGIVALAAAIVACAGWLGTLRIARSAPIAVLRRG
ncbi:MAG: FtsX-like permease family protein [Rhodanobacter sp.]|jgi:putative ABC transport system permease protein|nr:FtsX-like permease family protein [Rhodanobacter sp.]